MFILTCEKTGRFWSHRTEGMARRAELTLGLKDYTIMPAAQQDPERALGMI